MVGNDATIKIGSNVAGALAGIMAIQMGMKNIDKTIMASAAIVKKSAIVMGAALAGAGIVAAIGVKKATDNFREFEQSAVNAASVGGKVGEEFVKVKENIMDMSKTLGRQTMFTAGQSADALWHFASAGYDVGTMVKDDFKPVMDLAAGTEMDLARTTHWVASAISQFGLEMEDAGRVADIYAITNGNTLATVEKLGLGMVYVGTQASLYNDTIEDTTYLLGLMANRGLRGEQSGRGLSMAYRRLAVPTARAADEIKRLGLTLEEVSPDGNKMIDILKKFESAGLSATSATIIFGQEASKAVTAAVGGLGNLDLYNKIMNSTGFAALLAAEQLDTLKGTTRIFHSALEVLSIEIGEFSGFYLKGLNLKLIDLVNVMIDKVEPTFVRLQELLDDLSPTFTAIRDSVESLKGIFEDLADALGFTDDSFDKFVNSVNIIAVSIALVLNFIDKHPNIVKFALAIAFAAAMFVTLVPAITAVLTIGGYLITFITGLGTILGVLTTFLVTGFIPAWVGAWLAALGPITLVAAAISVLATLWVFDIGGMRDITSGVVTGIVDSFWWMVGQLMNAANYLVDKLNAVRDALGFEPIIPLEFDVDRAKDAYREMGKNLKTVLEDTMDESIGIDFLDSTQQSADYIARESAEFLKNTMEIDRNTEALQNNILAKGNYADKFGFDISGMSMSQSREAIDAYRRGDLEDQVVNSNSSQATNNGQGMSVGNMDVNIGELVIDSNGDDAIGDAIINEVKSVGGVI